VLKLYTDIPAGGKSWQHQRFYFFFQWLLRNTKQKFAQLRGREEMI
jgi:hypothetical protein